MYVALPAAIFISYDNGGLPAFSCFALFLVKEEIDINSEECIVYGDSHIDKPQSGRPKRAELPDANITDNSASQNCFTNGMGRGRSNSLIAEVNVSVATHAEVWLRLLCGVTLNTETAEQFSKN